MRTVFNRSTVSARIPVILGVLTALTLGGGIVMLTVPSGGFEPTFVGVFLTLVGALSLVVLLFVLRGLRNPYRLEFVETGVTLQVHGDTVDIPWTDIDSWEMAEQVQRRKGVPQLRAFPADHVGDPTDGDLDAIWSIEHRCWVLCEPATTDGTADELVAAARKFAADKERGQGSLTPER